ncbi:MAG TPA: hypothetical protein VF473_05175 [Cyclobacteriaceae bacterium]
MKVVVRVLRFAAFRLSSIAKRLNTISLLSPSEKKILARNRQFKDKHKGKRAFVIVNGPSLKEQDITPLGSDITFVVSGFFRHPVIKEWQPSYYCILDQYFFNGSEQSANFFVELKEHIKTSTFFIPLYRGYSRNERANLIDKEKTYYVAAAGQPNRNLEMDNVVQAFAGVSAMALAEAIYMGCSPIYLLGFDHDYLANRGFDRHFYQGGTVKGSSVATKTMAERIPYDNEMAANYALWKNYRSLHAIAKRKGIEIYNATRGGYLDVFERRDYKDLFKNS